MNAMALEYYINHYIKTLDQINLETSMEYFSDDFEIEQEPEEPEWPEDDDEETE